MSNKSQRPGNEEIKALKSERIKAGKALREKQKAEGFNVGVKAILPNRKSGYENIKEEQEARQAAATDQMKLFFPEIDIPHNDTLKRLLSVIEVDEIEAALMEAVHKLIKNKKFSRYYEHAFSYNWNAMKGYHYLMRLGHFINVLAVYSECLIETVREFGVRCFIRFVRETLVAPWLNAPWVKERLGTNFQLRLI